ncbi:hypothetical protein B0A48_05942 [Cryoendolithus antarcticus]|uniref:Uncharacterized protein n=1 Tax=Cryoendolithus antarcticus TaxID=1507870 RepID=A0A1V8TCR7_9PEZI|nr:hypothetical protein B0A48_05942 [Cryoendolithus antarcticus]
MPEWPAHAWAPSSTHPAAGKGKTSPLALLRSHCSTLVLVVALLLLLLVVIVVVDVAELDDGRGYGFSDVEVDLVEELLASLLLGDGSGYGFALELDVQVGTAVDEVVELEVELEVVEGAAELDLEDKLTVLVVGAAVCVAVTLLVVAVVVPEEDDVADEVDEKTGGAWDILLLVGRGTIEVFELVAEDVVVSGALVVLLEELEPKVWKTVGLYGAGDCWDPVEAVGFEVEVAVVCAAVDEVLEGVAEVVGEYKKKLLDPLLTEMPNVIGAPTGTGEGVPLMVVQVNGLITVVGTLLDAAAELFSGVVLLSCAVMVLFEIAEEMGILEGAYAKMVVVTAGAYAKIVDVDMLLVVVDPLPERGRTPATTGPASMAAQRRVANIAEV